MRVLASIVIVLFSLCTVVIAADYEITQITPFFNDDTPGFGEFKIEVGIKNNLNRNAKINVACLYLGLTRPGVYFKNEPNIMKQYKVVRLGPSKDTIVTFEQGFSAYHPATAGEIIISLVGTEVVRSLALVTRFHPKSND